MSKTRLSTLIVLIAGAGALAGCGSSGVFNRERPDEFAVQRQTPLVVPPDFALTPPTQGEPRPAERTLQDQTLEALFGGPASRSEVEADAVSRAGSAAPGIRSSVGDLETHTVGKGQVTRQILAAPEGDGQAARTGIGS